MQNNDEQEENYEYMRGSHTLLGDDENVVVNISENAESIVQHTLMDIIDKSAVTLIPFILITQLYQDYQ